MRYLNFTQIMSVRSDNPEAIVEMAAEWDQHQATSDVMGYMGSHVLADRNDPGHYLIVAEFGVVDPDVSAADEAMKNNDRPVTQEWARKLDEVTEGETEFSDYDEIYRTG
ncbi:MAG: hypothetical protein ACRDWD_10530 [Acidimicrobiia bacterium]